MTADAPIDLTAVKTVLAHSADEVLVVDPRGRLVWANAHARRALPAAGGRLADRDWCDLWPTEAAARIRSALGRVRPAADQFTALRDASGRQAWVDLSVVPLDAGGNHAGYLVTLRDVTERERSSRAREILLEEMRHRQGNTLTLASTLLHVHARSEPGMARFAEEMGRRLAAMGRAQRVVAHENRLREDVGDLGNMLEVLVRPLMGPDCALVIDVEPGVVLPGAKIDVVAMVLSELAVNSVKHGAFLHGGRVALSVVRTDGGIEFDWQERSSADVTVDARGAGQGQALMARFAAVNDGRYEVFWRPRGQLARLILRDEAPGGRFAA
jgi:PAS domain S-box-containing protein